VQLTDEEHAMLAGEQGTLIQKSMEILVTLGEIYGATRMVEVTNVHSPGVSYRVAGDAGLDYVKEASGAGHFRVRTTLNTGGIDGFNWKEIGFPPDFVARQLELNTAYEDLGASPTYTCTPYLSGSIPQVGEHVAWGESSAIIFANSVLGARTNREGGPTALAAAVTGRVPAYGLHLDENRKANWLVRVNMKISSDRDFAVLGYFVGQTVGGGVPLFSGIHERPTLENYKALGAALASSGAVALYHVEGLTPEAPTKDAVLAQTYQTIDFGPIEYEAVVAKFSPAAPVNAVIFGCPHCSIEEMHRIAEALDGRRLHMDMWVCVSHPVYALAERSGYVRSIEDAGATILRDTCPILGATLDKGFKVVATNSGKLAHYMRGLWNVETSLLQFEDCIAVALQ